MGRWFEQQGVIHSLFTTRRSHHHPWPFTSLNLAGTCCVIPVSGNTFQRVVLDYLMGFPFTVSLNVALEFVVSRNRLLKVVLKSCLHLRVCWSPASAKTGVVAVSVYCWQGGCTFNPEPPSCLPTLYQRGEWWLVLTLLPLSEYGAFIHLVIVIVCAIQFKYPPWETHV